LVVVIDSRSTDKKIKHAVIDTDDPRLVIYIQPADVQDDDAVPLPEASGKEPQSKVSEGRRGPVARAEASRYRLHHAVNATIGEVTMGFKPGC
jgi:hypothetical protein